MSVGAPSLSSLPPRLLIPNKRLWPPSSPTYDDVYDGRKCIRVLNPCSYNLSSADCQWFNNPAVLPMQEMYWYFTAEALADSRLSSLVDSLPVTTSTVPCPTSTPHVRAERDAHFRILSFEGSCYRHAIHDGHTYLIPSGQLLVQANLSTSQLPTVSLRPRFLRLC